MTTLKKVKPAGEYMGRLRHGRDLLEEITDFCIREKIRLARIEALGAVQKARLAYYNQETRGYQFFDIQRRLEITKLTGNVSIKDGSPMVHAHITLADEEGRCFGGHLAQGTVIFACEVIVQAFSGPLFERRHDSDTGLPLWDMKQ